MYKDQNILEYRENSLPMTECFCGIVKKRMFCTDILFKLLLHIKIFNQIMKFLCWVYLTSYYKNGICVFNLFQNEKIMTFFYFALCINYSEVFSCIGCCICCIWHPCRSPVCATACAQWRFVLCRYASKCTYIRERVFNKGLYAKCRLSGSF